MSLAERISDFLGASPVRNRKSHIQDLPSQDVAEGILHIDTPDPTAEDRICESWQQKGLRLARQEDWSLVSEIFKEADAQRTLTPGGMSVAELISFGARADVVGAVEHALIEGRPEQNAPLIDGIEALETVLSESPQDSAIALIVAQAHMDIGWAWRGTGLTAQVPALNLEAFDAHVDRARDILTPFCSGIVTSPALLSAWCALIASRTESKIDLANQYEALIDLNPMDIRKMRALGVSLLPEPGGSYDQLELEARRTAARLHHIWGAGGYTWVMFDAVANDPHAMAQMDADYFNDGLRDILARRKDQYTINLLAAYCAVTMSNDTGLDAADFKRSCIHASREWIICGHLKELHPLVWAHATHGFDNAMRVRSINVFATRGLNEAHRVLKTIFARELARGQNVTFTQNGPITDLV